MADGLHIENRFGS